MKKRSTISPLSILLVILVSGVFYSSVYAVVVPTATLPSGTTSIGDKYIDPALLNPIICGDGELEQGEECDDGNTNDNDACHNDCTSAYCGDGDVWYGHEQCDDGNTSNSDSCLNTCVNASCGDGNVHSGVEQCDDGNGLNTDACTNSCLTAVCGDGYIRANVEECDDGNTMSGDGCSNTCENELGPDSAPPTGIITPTFSGIISNGLALLNQDVTIGSEKTPTSQPTGTSPKALFTLHGLGLVDAHKLDISVLTVDKKTAGDFVIYDDLTVGPNFGQSGHWASPVTTLYGVTKHLTGPILLGSVGTDNNTYQDEVLYVGDFDAWTVPASQRDDGDVVIQGDLTVGFNGTGNISAKTIGGFYRRSITGTNFARAYCDNGSFLTGCTGYVTSTSIPYRGARESIYTESCAAYAGGSVTAYATCFDPTGATSD